MPEIRIGGYPALLDAQTRLLNVVPIFGDLAACPEDPMQTVS
jgi:hypothetical protein